MRSGADTQATEMNADELRPEWMRAAQPPEMLQRSGVAMPVMTRMADWPRLPEQAPSELVVRVSAKFVELRVGNVLPTGIWSFLLGVWFAPMVATFAAWGFKAAFRVSPGSQEWVAGGMFAVALLQASLLVVIAYLIYRAEIQGAASDILTLLDHRTGKVYQRLSKKLSKGEWNWDDLHPYIENRNAISRVNQVLTLVELDEGMQKIEGSLTVEVTGMSPEPLFHTYSFLKEFMEHGVTNLPPVKLAGMPEPAWYSSMPPWFFWLPRPVAKSIWAFALLLFVWPIVVWSRIVRRVLPYSRWPAEFERKLKASEADGTPAEKAWLAANVTPAQRPPVMAYAAFAAAVVVSAPGWWWIVQGYAAGLAKFW
jgi:hypothetical protein